MPVGTERTSKVIFSPTCRLVKSTLVYPKEESTLEAKGHAMKHESSRYGAPT